MVYRGEKQTFEKTSNNNDTYSNSKAVINMMQSIIGLQFRKLIVALSPKLKTRNRPITHSPELKTNIWKKAAWLQLKTKTWAKTAWDQLQTKIQAVTPFRRLPPCERAGVIYCKLF